MKSIKYSLIGFVVICTPWWLSGCNDGIQTNEENSELDAKIQHVEVTHPEYRSFDAELLITGTAEPYRHVMLHAMESGFVKKVYKDIGDVVLKGEVLADLENPAINRQSEQLKAEVEGKKSVYERLLSTYEKTPDLTPVQLVEDARAEYLSVKAKLDAIYDRISFLKVKAPFAGVITQRFVDEGALVQSGLSNTGTMPLFELQDANPIRLTIPLPESDAGVVKKGGEVIVSFPELPGKSFKARVSRTANSFDMDSRTMQAEVDIPNPDGKLKPGMYAKVLMQLNSRDSVLSLPVTSKVIYQNQPFILLVENGTVKRLPLLTGLTNKDYFELLNSEITSQALVIVKGKGLVKPGQNVKPVLKSE